MFSKIFTQAILLPFLVIALRAEAAASAYLSSSPEKVPYTVGTTINWQASGSSACYGYDSRYGSWTQVPLSGQFGTGALYYSVTFALYCYGYDGIDAYRTVSVQVSSPPPGISQCWPNSLQVTLVNDYWWAYCSVWANNYMQLWASRLHTSFLYPWSAPFQMNFWH